MKDEINIILQTTGIALLIVTAVIGFLGNWINVCGELFYYFGHIFFWYAVGYILYRTILRLWTKKN